MVVFLQILFWKFRALIFGDITDDQISAEGGRIRSKHGSGPIPEGAARRIDCAIYNKSNGMRRCCYPNVPEEFYEDWDLAGTYAESYPAGRCAQMKFPLCRQ